MNIRFSPLAALFLTALSLFAQAQPPYTRSSAENLAGLQATATQTTSAYQAAEANRARLQNEFYQASSDAFQKQAQADAAAQAVSDEVYLAYLRREINRIMRHYSLGVLTWEQNQRVNSGDFPPELYQRIADGKCHLSDEGLLTMIRNAMNGNYWGLNQYGGLVVPWRVWAYFYGRFQNGVYLAANPNPEQKMGILEFMTTVWRR